MHRPIERARNERRVVSAWSHSVCKKGSRRCSRKEKEKTEVEGKKEEEVGGKREGNRLSTQSISRGGKIRRHENRINHNNYHYERDSAGQYCRRAINDDVPLRR